MLIVMHLLQMLKKMIDLCSTPKYTFKIFIRIMNYITCYGTKTHFLGHPIHKFCLSESISSTVEDNVESADMKLLPVLGRLPPNGVVNFQLHIQPRIRGLVKQLVNFDLFVDGGKEFKLNCKN